MGIVPDWLSDKVFKTKWEAPGCPEPPGGKGHVKIVFYAYTDTGLYTEDMSKEPYEAPSGIFSVIAGGVGIADVIMNGVLEHVEEADLLCSWWTVIPPTAMLPQNTSHAHALYKFQRVLSSGKVRMLPSRYTYPGGVGMEVEV